MNESGGRIDLLVLGGGMAGLSAAAYACEQGASVVLAEKAPTVGGSAQYARFIHTPPTLDVMGEVNPGGDPKLTTRLVEGFASGLDWVRSLGTDVGEPISILGYSRGSRTDMAHYLLACERSVREHGELLTNASAERLLIEDGAVTGAVIRTASGERTVHARSTLLATGGFGGDPELRAQHIHPLARDLPLRANTYSTGDGLRLAQPTGAGFGAPGAGFYGHLIPSCVSYTNPFEFVELTFYHGEHGIILNLDGRRFCDETLGDHLNALEVLEQREARALMITDQRVHEEWMLTPYVEGAEVNDKFKLAYQRGARAAIAEDIDEFDALPEEWGYPGHAVRDALQAFNEQCASGTPSPGRARDAVPVLDPAVLRDRGHSCDHPHVQRADDRRARARPRRAGQSDPRAARGRCRRGRRVSPRVHRRAGDRSRLRPAGRHHSRGSDGEGVMRATGKVVVVTGAAGGQGAAEAASTGARRRDRHRPRRAGAARTRSTGCTTGSSTSPTRRTGTTCGVALERDFGAVHGLVNNAAITSRTPLGQVTVEELNRVLAVNLTGPLLAIQALAPLMTEGGSIVNVSSIAAQTGHFPPAYTASKWGLRGLSRVASMELGRLGIRVNTILPGVIVTPMAADAPEAFTRAVVNEIPLGRRGTAEDVAPLVVFLISDESPWISGAEISVDGGQAAHGGMKQLADAVRLAGVTA